MVIVRHRVVGHGTVGRLEPEDAAEACWNTNRTAAVTTAAIAPVPTPTPTARAATAFSASASHTIAVPSDRALQRAGHGVSTDSFGSRGSTPQRVGRLPRVESRPLPEGERGQQIAATATVPVPVPAPRT